MLRDGYQQTSSGIVIKGKRPDTYGCRENFMLANEDGVMHSKGGAAQGVGPWGPGRFLALYDSADGTPAENEIWGPRSGTFKLKLNTGGFRVIKVYDSTNHLVIVEAVPFTELTGTANADIASGAAGTVSILYRSSSTAFTDTTADTPSGSVVNALDQTVKSGSKIECVYSPYPSSGTMVEGWKIIQSDFTC
jgi:hypothetical protein